MTDKVYVGIVSFNPDIQILKENILSIHNQTDSVVIFDNGSKNINEINNVVSKFNNVKLISSNKNIGIAAALNNLMQWGEDKNYGWMLSLDQDSICSNDYIRKMIPFLSVEDNLGIVAPVIIDRAVGAVGHVPKSVYSHVKTCITSGAFSKIEAWSQIGKYDEYLFIDSVDFEYCYRMRINGFGVIQVRDVKLLHKIGESQIRRFLFWKVNVGGHSSFRKYYIARNTIYYPLKHHLWLRLLRGNLRNISLIFIILLYEEEKEKKIKSILEGWKDAYKAR